MPKRIVQNKRIIIYTYRDNEGKYNNFESKDLPKMKKLFISGKIRAIWKEIVRKRDKEVFSRDLLYDEKNNKFSWDTPDYD